MARAELLPLRTIISIAAIALAIAACARNAPELPPMAESMRIKPVSSTSCVDIDQQLDQLSARMDRLEGDIQSNRHSNQTLGYLGVFFLLPLIGLESNTAEKASLDAEQHQRDRLLAERTASRCPSREFDSTGRVRPIVP